MEVNKNIIYLFFIPLFWFFPTEARQLSLGRLDSDKGLSQHTITCIAQNKQGFMWFGTKEGLNRFDGYHFKVYDFDITDTTTVANGDINALFNDEQDRLWIATNGGLSLYNSYLDCFTNYSEGLNSLEIKTIAQENDSIFWVGTAIYGLYSFNANTGIFTHYPNDLSFEKRISMNIRAIRKGAGNTLWVGSEDGIRQFNTKTRKYEGLAPFMQTFATEQGRINCFFVDSDGDWWIGTYGGGIHCLPQGSNSLKSFVHEPNNTENELSNNFIHSINEDHRNRIWIGTSNGLNIYHKQTERFSVERKAFNQVNSLAADRVLSLHKDSLGILWIGTENGINFYDAHREKFQSKGNNATDIALLGNNSIQSIYQEPSGNLWLGTGSGLTRLNDVMSESQQFVISEDASRRNSGIGISEEAITAILPNGIDELWLGTQSQGIAKFNIDNGSYKLIQHGFKAGKGISSNTINHLSKDAKGRIWVATEGGGLNCWIPALDSFLVYKSTEEVANGLTSNFISCTAPSKKDGTVWVGTYGGGLCRLNPETNTFESYKNNVNDSSTISSNLVNVIMEDSKGILWIGTQAGLNSFDPQSKTFHSFNFDKSSTSYIIKSIAEDVHGDLWLSSNKGLICYSSKKKTFKVYDEKDGLQGNLFHERSIYQASNGNLFFGGFNGFTFFHPSRIQNNPHIPPVIITNLLVDNTPIKIKKHPNEEMEGPFLSQAVWASDFFEIDYTNRVISFEFAALNYRLPEKNQYRFKLEPFETEWVYKDADRREATYTNLAPNKYTFWLQASNNDGVWNEESIKMSFEITPPIWRTWWMQALIALLLGSITWTIYRMRVRRIKQTRDELERQVFVRTKQLKEKTDELENKAEELANQKEEIMQINDQLGAMNDQLEIARQKSDEMLLNILPKETAKELQEKGFYTPRNYQMASVLFTDFKSFTAIAEALSPDDLIKELDYFFQYFDKVIDQHNLEKIKTIGDAYMCAGGIPKPNYTNAVDTVLAGLDIVAFTQRVNAERIAKNMQPWQLRIGINTGPLVAGVVGKKKFAYDIWGDAVNLASRMESSGDIGKVNISDNTYQIVKDFFVCHHRGKIFAKGKGEIDMYYVEAIRPELSLDADGHSPNASFRIKVKELMMKHV